MNSDVLLSYRQHLTEADRRLLAGMTGPAGERDLGAALESPALEAVLFGGESVVADGLIGTSPFLTFAVAVHRTAARLRTTTYVEERWALRQRIPVFDVGTLRAVLDDPALRFFLVELLTSYTHVASGVTWRRTPRGWRRRRFSELDPVRLAEVLEAVPAAERAGIYRRLGDLSLFLVGVFADHPSVFNVGPVATTRLVRLSGLPGLATGRDDELSGAELLEQLGRRWYQLAVRSASAHLVPVTDSLTVVRDVATRFTDVRRVLNVITDWYLFPLRERWFGV